MVELLCIFRHLMSRVGTRYTFAVVVEYRGRRAEVEGLLTVPPPGC